MSPSLAAACAAAAGGASSRSTAATILQLDGGGARHASGSAGRGVQAWCPAVGAPADAVARAAVMEVRR